MIVSSMDMSMTDYKHTFYADTRTSAGYNDP